MPHFIIIILCLYIPITLQRIRQAFLYSRVAFFERQFHIKNLNNLNFKNFTRIEFFVQQKLERTHNAWLITEDVMLLGRRFAEYRQR